MNGLVDVCNPLAHISWKALKPRALWATILTLYDGIWHCYVNTGVIFIGMKSPRTGVFYCITRSVIVELVD